MQGSRAHPARTTSMVAWLRSAPREAGPGPQSLDDLAAEALERHGGWPFAEDAEASVFSFQSPDAAIRFAAEIAQRAGAEAREGAPPSLGVHSVRPVGRREADAAEEAGRAACRLARFAHGGGVVASGTALAAMEAAPPRTMRPVGTLTLRPGAPPVEVFRAGDASYTARVGEVLRFGAYELDTGLFELRHEGARVPLEPLTFDLLALLARNAHRTVSRDEVFMALWGERFVSDAALSGQIKAARRAVGDDGVMQHTIVTVHGRGFRFVQDVIYGGGEEAAAGKPAAPAPERLSCGRPVVAVLPFDDLGPSDARDFFADGLTEDIITALARNRSLAVIARNPAFSFRHADALVTEIAAELGARYLVAGSVRRANGHVRVAVQLVDGWSGHCLWSERLHRQLADIVALEENVAALISSRLATELGVAEQRRARAQPGESLDAWEHYQLGSAEFYRFTAEGNRRSQALLQQAIAEEPDFAQAHARLAYAIILEMVYFEGALDQARFDDALRIARRAVALDDQDANSYFVLGRVHLARCEHDRAMAALEHGLELNPCFALIHCGLGESLAHEERFDEAFGHFDAAVELSPHDPFRWAFYAYRALAHFFAADYAHAAYWARRATDVPNAHYWARAHLVAALGHLRDIEQAGRERAELLRECPGFTRAFAGERMFYVKNPAQRAAYLSGLAQAGVE